MRSDDVLALVVFLALMLVGFAILLYDKPPGEHRARKSRGLPRWRVPKWVRDERAKQERGRGNPFRCGSCGYDMSGLPQNVICPECGFRHSRNLP